MEKIMIDSWKIQWKELFLKSVEQLPKHLTLSYSGGFDSSIILYSLIEMDRKPDHCITFQVGEFESKDLFFTKRACKSFDIPLQIVKIPIKNRTDLIEDCRYVINKLNNSRQIDVQCATVFNAMFPIIQTKDIVLGFYESALYKSGKKVAVNYSKMKRGLITETEHIDFYKEIRKIQFESKSANPYVLLEFIKEHGINSHAPLFNQELFDYSMNFGFQDFHFTGDGKLWIKYFLYQLWQPFFDKIGNHHNKNNFHVVSKLKEYHEKVLLAGTNHKMTVSIYNKIFRGEL